MKMPPNIDHHHSNLLTAEENMQIFKLLGNRCLSISTSVVQLYCTNPPLHSHWIKKETGVLCFVKDNSRKNYFFRIFCLKKNIMVWEHEIYNDMEYIENGTSFFHNFEGEDCLVAFNFADQDEARYLKGIVDQKITIKRRKMEKKYKQSGDQQTRGTSGTDLVTLRKNPDSAAEMSKRRRNLTKADIGQPMDFKHISHVGWNPHSGFDINSQDEQLKTFFEKAGVSEKQLQDRDTREFIYNFINNYGSTSETCTNTSNPPRRAPSAPPHSDNAPAIPPRGTPRPSHTRAAPPPPPTFNNNESTRHVVNNVPPEKPGIPPPPSGAMPPAPPPPPMPKEMMTGQDCGDVPPPAPPVLDNTALLESIRSGTTLKPVEERKVAPQEDARSDLLSDIRKGLKLKPVDERDLKPIVNMQNEQNSSDLAGALARALAERNKAIHSEDDDDDDSEDFNDDDWE